MSPKTINTKIQLRYDTLTNWSTTGTAPATSSGVNVAGSGTASQYVPLKGEVCVAQIDTETSGSTRKPVMFKVGDGSSTFASLDWASAKAADVYAWARASEDDFLAWAKTKNIAFTDVSNNFTADQTVSGTVYVRDTSKTNTVTSIEGGQILVHGQNDNGFTYETEITHEKINTENIQAYTITAAGITGKILGITSDSTITAAGNITGAKLITKDGTSSQFVKGDGSLDSNQYVLAADVVQSDWSVTDSSSNAFIKNKPTLGTAAAKAVATVVTSGSADLPTSGAVATYVSGEIGKVKQFSYVVSTSAATTPERITWYSGTTLITGTLAASSSTEFKIYLVPCAHTSGATITSYHEYLTVKSGTSYSWEKIGTTDTDMSNYVTLDTAQSISGAKTFTNSLTTHSIYPTTTVTYSIGAETACYNQVYAVAFAARNVTGSGGYTKYSGNSITYQAQADTAYTLSFPAKAGTLALTSDTPNKLYISSTSLGSLGGKSVGFYSDGTISFLPTSGTSTGSDKSTIDYNIKMSVGSKVVTTDDTLILNGGTATTVI